MYLGKADVNAYDKGVEREFLVSNGMGSYGSSTVVGANTRREHGLLVVRPHDSEQHTVLISKLEETLYTNNKKYQLSTNRYKDLIYPDGYRYVQEYQGTPFPSVLFVIHSIFLKKSIFMPQNGTCTVVKYELVASPEQIFMDVRPLFAHRSATDAPCAEQPQYESSQTPEGVVNVKGRGYMSHVSFAGASDSLKWSNKPLWFENLIYERDGMPDNPSLDCLWSPGFGSIGMKEGDVVYVVLSEEPIAYAVEDLKALEKETTDRLDSFIKQVAVNTKHTVLQDMVQGSCHLVADNRGSAPAIFSGFPSVEQRARDTFISLPGLTLATGRAEVARGILANWLEKAASCENIMPASIDNQGVPKLGDIDAGLWFLYAADKYSSEVSMDFAKENAPAIRALLEKYKEGDARLGAVMDADSKLIKFFNRDNTKHWMSGDVSGEPLVERRGYLVEMSALWYNALKFVQSVADATGDSAAATEYEALAEEVAASFVRTFWNEEEKYLYDWVDPTDGERDDAIRPNAIFAVSLPHPVVADDEKGKQIFATCWNELYTTYGLRTLDPHHDKFKGRAEGRPDQKKKARLRGMAWPWLLGHFTTAYMRFYPEKKEMGWSFLRPFSSHLRRGCLGGVAEYFDGMMPYRPNGDVLAAISQGELLRVMHENLA